MIGQAIGQALPFAVGVALSPVPIIAAVLMLSIPKGSVNGLAFLTGWVVGTSRSPEPRRQAARATRLRP
jgi:hypothetical protein